MGITLSNVLGSTVTGSEIEAGTVSDSDLASPNNSAYKLLFTGHGEVAQNTAAFTGFFAATVVSPAATDISPLAVHYLDPADYAVAGLTTRYRVRGLALTNGTPPAVNFTFGFYPISASGGAANVISMTAGTVQSGSTGLVTAPSASTQNEVDSGDFTAPAAGYYALGVVTSGTTAASSDTMLVAQLDVRNT